MTRATPTQAHSTSTAPLDIPASRRSQDPPEDVILISSSPEHPPSASSPVSALPSMPPPSTKPTTSKFSLCDISFSSSPIPERTVWRNPASNDASVRPSDSLPPQECITLSSSPAAASGPIHSAYFDQHNSFSSHHDAPLPVQNRADKVGPEDVVLPSAQRYQAGDLVPAVQRRRDWTPPPVDTGAILDPDLSAVLDQLSSPTEHDGDSASPHAGEASLAGTRRASADVFKGLLGNFGCKDGTVSPSKQPAASMAGQRLTQLSLESFARRKPIEAVSLGASLSKKSPTKAPKKKPRTITELAMAQFADPDADDVNDDAELPDQAPHTATAKKRGRPKRQLELFEDAASHALLPTQPAVVRSAFPTAKQRKLKPATGPQAKPGPAEIGPDGKPVKKPRKAPVKKAPAKAPAQRMKKQVVLTPEAARTESMRQDFLFGTSSQLAAEQSPTFLRQLHDAMVESNENARQSMTDALEDASVIDLTGHTSAAITRSGPRTKLWGAAWRGDDGAVTFDHVIDLDGDEAAAFPEDPHEVIKQQALLEATEDKKANENEIPLEKTDEKPEENQAQQTDWTSRNDFLPSAQSTGEPVSKSATQGTVPSISNESNLPVSASAPLAPAALVRPSTPPSTPACPDFNLLTTPQLARKVSTYGFKPITTRKDMVALLNRCWAAKNGVSLSTVQAASMSTTSAASAKASPKAAAKASPKKTTARKPAAKTATKTTKTTKATKVTKAKTPPKKQPVYEIEDSEASDDGGTLPRGPSRAQSAARMLSPEVSASVVSETDVERVLDTASESDDGSGDENDSLAAAPTCEEALLFARITHAVLTPTSSLSQRSTAQQPTWYEKILLYDTIILEEFTEWLNSAPAGLRHADEQEITLVQAKKWCESKSVCCTTLNTQRGIERKL